MRQRLVIPHERRLSVLRRLGPSGAPVLEEALAVPRTTLLRLLAEQSPALVAAGAARRRRYAARRGLRGDAQDLPVYRVDRDGQAHAAGVLQLIEPQGSCWALDDALWPVPAAARDGWWSGLPYPVREMRVQGYMGRQFALRHHDDLGLPPDPRD